MREEWDEVWCRRGRGLVLVFLVLSLVLLGGRGSGLLGGKHDGHALTLQDGHALYAAVVLKVVGEAQEEYLSLILEEDGASTEEYVGLDLRALTEEALSVLELEVVVVVDPSSSRIRVKCSSCASLMTSRTTVA